jgi:hypothetical protein
MKNGMRYCCLFFVSLIMLTGTVAAQFEGQIDMKFTTANKDGSGEFKTFLSKAGTLGEMKIQAKGSPIDMKILFKTASPDMMYMINDAKKAYTEIDMKKNNERSDKMKDEKYTVKKLPNEKIMGYDCKHVVLTDEKGSEMEFWTNKDVADYQAFAKLMSNQNPRTSSFEKALKESGAEGLPLKMIARGKDGKDNMTMEVTKVEKKSLPASTFEIPTGYAKQDAMSAAMDLIPADQQKKIQEQMKNMTPEQRKMLEDMMKQNSGK